MCRKFALPFITLLPVSLPPALSLLQSQQLGSDALCATLNAKITLLLRRLNKNCGAYGENGRVEQKRIAAAGFAVSVEKRGLWGNRGEQCIISRCLSAAVSPPAED